MRACTSPQIGDSSSSCLLAKEFLEKVRFAHALTKRLSPLPVIL